MTDERVFGRWITPDKTHKGVIIIDGDKLKNPSKAVRVPENILEDLSSLAIEAFRGEFEDSFGQSYLDDEVKKLKKKYPSEQPQEVWRRDLASVSFAGVTVEDVAGALMTRNPKLMASINLGSISVEARQKVLATISDKIREYWPSTTQTS